MKIIYTEEASLTTKNTPAKASAPAFSGLARVLNHTGIEILPELLRKVETVENFSPDSAGEDAKRKYL
jgi:hypothetical protein